MNLKKNETLQLLDDQVPESVDYVSISSIDSYLEETPMDITVEGGFFTDAQGVYCKNCGSHSLEYLKKYGLKGLVNLNTTSKPAKTASVLTGHLNTFLASMQAYYAGALGLGYVNVLYAPLLVGATDKELKQIGQELIFNCSQNAFSRGGQSLHPDELIWVKENGTYKNVPIGEYVDKYLEENKDAVERRDQYELLRTEGKGIETVSFDEKTGESLIKEVSYLARMPHKGKMYRFETSRGNINITGDHSVFVYTKDGKIAVVKASELKIGDLLVAPSYVPDGSSDIGNNNDKEEGKKLAEFVVLAKELTPVDSSILSKSHDFKSSFVSTVLDLTPHKEGYSSWRFSKDDKRLVSLIGMILLESGECPIVREERDEIIFDVDDDPEVISNNYHGDTDLLTVKIDYIEEYDYEGPVYDLSVPGTEAFLGGVGNIYLHNTLFIDTNIHSGIPSYLENVPAIGPAGKYYADVDGINMPLEERTLEGDWCLVLPAKEEGQDDRILLREHEGKQTFYDDGITHVMRYGDYKEEAARFAEALLEVWKEGDANGHVFEFPKCDFHVSAETFTDARQYRVFQKACELASHNGSTYFVFDRDSVSLASCCFAPMTPVLIKDGTEIHRMSIVGAYAHYSKTNKTIRVYDRGTWRKAKVIRLKGKGRRMLTVKFACNKEVTCTADHEFPTKDGVKKAYELTPNDLVEMSTEVLKNKGDSGFARLCGALATLAVFTKHPKGQGKLVFDVCNDIDGVKIGMDEFLLGALRDAGIKEGFAILPSDKGTYIEITNLEIINGVEELYMNVEGACCFSGRIYNTHEEARFAVLLSMLAATATPVEIETEQAEYLTNQLEAIATTVGVTLYNDPDEEGRLNFSPTFVGVKDKILNYGEKSYIKIDSIEEAPEENWVYCFSMMDTKKPFFTLPSGIVTHNCRLKVQITDMSLLQHPERLRTLGFQNVTINIPQCAYRAKHRMEAEGVEDFNRLNELFLEEIDHMMDLCKAAHAQKRKFIESIMVPGAPMWQMAMPANDGKPYLNLDTAVYIIGMLGLNDAVHYLTGEEMHESDAAMDYALKIMSHMFLRSKEYSSETGLTFKLEESPAESAARRLAKADLVYYRDDALKVFKGTEDAAYYTNSIHLAAAAPVTLVERIRKQSMFHSVIESGAIIHAFIAEETPSAGAIEELVTQTFLKTQCAQLVFSPEFTYCNQCASVQRGLVDTCDQCGSHNVVGETRVVGYFARTNNFNKSKRYGELVDRHKGKYHVEEAK